MMIVGHMFCGITGGLAGLGFSLASGHAALTSLASYPLGGGLGTLACVLWCEYRAWAAGRRDLSQ